jgi:hypothetical protein
MINVKFYKAGREYRGFESRGHAYFDEYGNDIVCAAVSTLIINTINAIEMLTKDKFKLSKNEEDGFIRIAFTNKKVSKETRLLLDALSLGLQGVKKEYGSKYIKIVSRRCK